MRNVGRVRNNKTKVKIKMNRNCFPEYSHVRRPVGTSTTPFHRSVVGLLKRRPAHHVKRRTDHRENYVRPLTLSRHSPRVIQKDVTHQLNATFHRRSHHHAKKRLPGPRLGRLPKKRDFLTLIGNVNGFCRPTLILTISVNLFKKTGGLSVGHITTTELNNVRKGIINIKGQFNGLVNNVTTNSLVNGSLFTCTSFKRSNLIRNDLNHLGKVSHKNTTRNSRAAIPRGGDARPRRGNRGQAAAGRNVRDAATIGWRETGRATTPTTRELSSNETAARKTIPQKYTS